MCEDYQALNACGYWKKHGGKVIVGSNFPIRDMGLSSILCCGVIKRFETQDVPKLVQIQPIPTHNDEVSQVMKWYYAP